MAPTRVKATAARPWTVGKNPMGEGIVADPPTRDARTAEFSFDDAPDFRPNMSPAEVLAAGSFGGGYFRDIESAATGEAYVDAWRELPAEWLEGLDVKRQVASTTYRLDVNRYGVNCGVKVDKSDAFGLKAWESSGWMAAQDPYGWFQWYCRFFQGRRSDDDERQLSRWMKCCGPRGRWKSNLIAKVLRDGKSFDDASVSPVVRQTLQHWGYRLTREHFDAGTARVKAKGAAYVPRSQLAHVLDAPAPAPAAPPAPRPRAPPRRRRDDSDADAEDGSSDTDATPLAAKAKPKSKQPKRQCRRD
mmetsp:Transcript_11775/g.35069  ORF Transcript_11775/g.35069 Transcript_11775/m.35069 type:complete len:303 (+) Transcript_11775:259-1167(+)